MASSSRLKPGEKGKVTVTVDVRGRMGNLSKMIKVYSNDPASPVTTLSVKMYIKDQLHMGQYSPKEIFGEKCRSCHVEQGVGKKGWDLYKADCFMCHNAGKKSSLTGMSKRPADQLLKALREGIENTVMPGWAIQHGGPLEEDDIRSLMELITR